MISGALARLAVRRHRAAIACGLLVIAVGLALASRLELQTDLAELLPPRAPSVVALRALTARVGGTGNVAIAIESDTGPQALRAYVPRLAEALRRELGPALLSLRYSRREVESYYRRFAAYYVPLAELQGWAARARRLIAERENPLYVDLDDRDELHVLADEIRAARGKLEPTNASDDASGLYMTEHGHLAVIFVRPASDSLNLGGSTELLARIDAIVDATEPARANVRVAGYTGSIPTAITEVDAVRRDVIGSGLLVIAMVGAAVVLYFRSLRVLVVLAFPLAVGIAVALGFAELAFGHVNAQTAFLGSIVVGVGINYGVIFIDRYDQVPDDVPVELAIERACDATLRATAIAALATAVAFGVLAAGEVESFRQFGWIGGIGILTSWLATFVVMPAFVVAIGRARRRRARPLAGLCARIGRACERAPRLIVGSVAVVAVSACALVYARRHELVETDMRALATRSSGTTGIEKLDNRLRVMDDRSSTPAVIATARRDDTRPVCDELNRRARGDLGHVLVRCYSLADLFPVDLDRRLPILASLRVALGKLDRDDLAPRDRDDLADLDRAVAESPPRDADLPQQLAEYFVERDGSLGKLAYVDPVDEHIESNLYDLTDALRSIRLPSGEVVESSGDLVVFADVLRAVRRDAATLTIAAALLVLAVLAAVSRRLGTTVRVGFALVAGVAIMAGVAVAFGDKLNFFNFVALPTTFGIGIDYAINIDERVRRRGTSSIPTALAASAPAVVLASVTSILGYASLLTADSRALSSFGALAIVGEVACVAVAVVLVPAMWLARR